VSGAEFSDDSEPFKQEEGGGVSSEGEANSWDKESFSEYSETEQKQWLEFFFYYYGQGVMTLAEIETFSATIEEYGPAKVFELVMANWISGATNAYPIQALIREELLDEAFSQLPNVEEFSDDVRELYNEKEKQLLAIVAEDLLSDS